MGEDTGPIISSQYMTHQLVVCYMLENIHTNLANFLGHHNPILLKNIGFSCANTTQSPLAEVWWCVCGVFMVRKPQLNNTNPKSEWLQGVVDQFCRGLQWKKQEKTEK
jgi:hypothetical protein